MVVSCKSWQSGSAATMILAQLRGEAKNPKHRAELQFRELWIPRWVAGSGTGSKRSPARSPSPTILP